MARVFYNALLCSAVFCYTQAAVARARARRAVLLLGVWRALTLAPLHAFAAVTSGLLVPHNLA